MSYVGAGLTQVVFNSSGSWVCPGGVISVLLIGFGGGGGGQDGNYGTPGGPTLGGSGGGGSILQYIVVPVTVGTSYTITIGAGGTDNTDGSPTTFGSLATFIGASGGGQNGYYGGSNIAGGYCIPNAKDNSIYVPPGCGGQTGLDVATISLAGPNGFPGTPNSISNSGSLYAGGTQSSGAAALTGAWSTSGSGGGGAGPNGVWR